LSNNIRQGVPIFSNNCPYLIDRFLIFFDFTFFKFESPQKREIFFLLVVFQNNCSNKAMKTYFLVFSFLNFI
jgi:hypothetical protein